MNRAIALSLFLLAGMASGQPPAEDGFGRLRNLPKGWSFVETVVVPDSQLAAIGRKLGGQVVRIVNTTLAVDGQRLKVNTLVCPTDDDTAKVHAALLRAHQGLEMSCPRVGKAIVEFVAKEARLVERAYLELGFPRPKMTYDVSFQAVPLVKCDYMQWNRMFNLLIAPEPNEVQIREISKHFTFGDRLRISNHGPGGEPSSYAFVPAPSNRVQASDGEVTAYSFADLPRKFDIPRVAVTGVVTSESFAMTATSRKAGPELLSATEYWPSTDAEIVALARQIVGQRTDPADKVTALLEWFAPGKNIRYGGQITGSRYGVNVVLKQRFGHCWDMSDCFVTLCRAAGVPCRQVLGWCYGLSGHVWAEVLIEGKGWRQVDPTAGMGCDCRYVPFVASEDGLMPMVYASMVRIVPREAKR